MTRAITRYEAIDDYTLEELRREYLGSDGQGRIRLLTELYAQTRPPFEIARLAGEDPDPRVRAWIARNGSLFGSTETS
jgi:hypothetical protein